MALPPRTTFLYKGDWTPSCDAILVETLLTLKAETHWSHDYFPSWFLLTAAEKIRNELGVAFTEAALLDRVQRKLFPDEVNHALDRESTTSHGVYFIDVAPDGQLRTQVEKGRDLPNQK
ncbi:hypothetical protein SASPL_114727 [Salvia splendens]|uniref:Uncharacterized protein n=1 Tax=Salvia splendens TaxID=180675 RepID=A0A8X8Y5B3_SALSN|nr:hypothetical protein SASPL_114727 [Salvia splendens]